MDDCPPHPNCSMLNECLTLRHWNETGGLAVDDRDETVTGFRISHGKIPDGFESAEGNLIEDGPHVCRTCKINIASKNTLHHDHYPLLYSECKLADCSTRMRSIVSFYICYLLCLFLGIACIVLVTVWNYKWRGGFAWDGSSLQFNWHPVLMVTGLVVLYGNGAVLYRVPLTWGQNKLPWKLLHAGVMLLALVFSVLGLCAVFEFHNANKTPNLYSLHSWIGICTTALFTLQWVLGLCGFLLPCSPMSLRKLLKPAHVWMGGSILILSMVSCISGINEKLFFALKGTANGTEPYANMPPEALVANSFGVLIVVFGLVILKILSNQHWQRPEANEDMRYSPLLQDDN